MKGISLSWLQLTLEKRRFMAALAGIAFAVVLMLMQLGFEDALLSTADLIHSHLTGDLVLINPHYQFILLSREFTARRLYQALGCDGVESVEPVYITQGRFKNPFDRSEREIFMVGFNPRSPVMNADGVAGNLRKLYDSDNVLFDAFHRPEFGPVEKSFAHSGPVVTEVNGRKVNIVGVFRLGTSFSADGTLLMSDEAFLRLSPRDRGIINVGMIKLKRGAAPDRVKAELIRILEPDVRVLTHAEFNDLDRIYWTATTPIGFIFKLGTLMGIFVGCIIVYQILYSDVNDHLPEYATLKAMGYPDWYLFKVVLQESMILSVLGYFPGLLVSQALYVVSGKATLLPLQMTVARSIVVYFLTLVMCAISATLAMRKLKAADPAEIF
jgi:putative ABC transport system permease protein